MISGKKAGFFILFMISAMCLSGIEPDKISVIYRGDDVTEAAGEAIRQFKAYMYFMNPQQKIEESKTPPKDNVQAAVFGKAAVDLGLITKAELEKASPNGYVLKITDRCVAMAGATPADMLPAVGKFARLCGMKYRSPFSATISPIIPENRPRTIPPQTVVDKPVFEYRNGGDFYFGNTSGFEVAAATNGLDKELFDKTKTGSDLWIDHTAGYLVPRLKYADEHPEYYALLPNGKRIGKDEFSDHRTPLCQSNPDVKRISAERALGWVDMNREKKYFHITNGDTGVWCQCEECMKYDDGPKNYSGRNMQWVNYVADKIYEKYPDKIVIAFAYAGTDVSPVKAGNPAKNIQMMLATGLGCLPFYEHIMKAQPRLCWDTHMPWLKGNLAHKPFVCEYIAEMYFPSPGDQTAERYRDYAKRGIGGIVYSYGRPWNFQNLWSYLHGALLWDPYQDPMALTKDFVYPYYEAGAEAIMEYFTLTHERYQATKNSTLDSHYPVDFYTDEFVRKSSALFDKAVSDIRDSRKGRHSDLMTEINNEKKLFLMDALKHLEDYKDKKTVDFIISEVMTLANQTGTKVIRRLKKDSSRASEVTTVNAEPYINDIIAVGTTLSKKKNDPSIASYFKEKAGSAGGRNLRREGDTIIFPLAMWTDFNFGPETFDNNVSHKKYPCPPKQCVGVFAVSNIGSEKNTFSKGEMSLMFELPQKDSGRSATLKLTGQTAFSKWAKDKELDLNVGMTVLVNDTEIYSGPAVFVRGNWSFQDLSIPANVLTGGPNEIKIRNTSKNRDSAAVSGWILVSSMQLVLGKASEADAIQLIQ